MRKSFGKSEKLTDLRVIKNAFKLGTNYYCGSLRLILLPLQAKPRTKSKLQVLISVPKRNIKKSVDRNRIKRQLREIYRLNKDYFFKSINNNDAPMALIIVYNRSTMPNYSDLNYTFLKWIKDTFSPNLAS